jgi:Flp pilus assembly protein TadG
MTPRPQAFTSRATANRHSPRRKGAVVVVAVVVITLTLGIAAIAIDLGYIQLVQSQLQNAADAAALSGASALVDGREAARIAARTVGAQNKAGRWSVEIVPNEDIEIGRWDDGTATFTALSSDDARKANAVRVTCRRSEARHNELPLLLGPLLGVPSSQPHAAATAMSTEMCGLLIGLDSVQVQNGKVDSYQSELGSYASQTPGQNGHLCSNGPITISPEGMVQGDAHPGSGFSVNRPDLVTGSVEPLKAPIRVPPVTPGAAASNNDNHSLPSWAWNGTDLVVGGTNVLQLAPGTYYIPGKLAVAGTAEIRITGPTTIYVLGNVDVAGKGMIEAGPGDLRMNLLGATAKFTGNGQLTAVIYGPATDILVEGNGAFCGAVVARNLVLKGFPAGIHADESLAPLRRELAHSRLVQ